jgi:hypothetical protein
VEPRLRLVLVEKRQAAPIEGFEPLLPVDRLQALVARAEVDPQDAGVAAAGASTRAGRPPRCSTQRRISSWSVVVLAMPSSLTDPTGK